MDYRKAYLQIVYRAKSRGIPEGYYEEHHILPRSLGGPDHSDNLTPLTAREHFLCHWLLVKMFKKGTIERRKMMYAFWRMRSSPDPENPRYINSRAYEKLRTEFAKYVSEQSRITQKGKRNSQYGKSWYTNYETGESHSFFEKPSNKWILGRYLFNGQSSKLIYRLKKSNKKSGAPRSIKVRNKEIQNRTVYLENVKKEARLETEKLWNRYHSGNYGKLEDFSRELGISKVALYYRFRKHIPIYSKSDKIKRQHFPSNIKLVDVFE